MRRPLLVLLITSLIPASTFAQPTRRTLTMRAADRAIDLAWQAELAADYTGARSALVELVKTSTTVEEIAAKERVEEWLRTLDEREKLYREHGKTARYYSPAFSSLKNFGPKRADDLWRAAVKQLPPLQRVVTETKAVALRPERLIGAVDRATTEKLVSQALSKYGLAVSGNSARFEVRIDVDASQSEPLERGARATAQASLVIRERGADGKYRVSGNVQKHKVEVRRTADEAKSFAMRRALDEASAALVFHLRSRMLEDAVGGEGARL
jgi:hypothetical protein